MAEFTNQERTAAAVAFEARELGHVVESARLIRIKFEAQQAKLAAADALVAEHEARLAAAREAHAELSGIPVEDPMTAVGSASALDATVRIEE